MGQAVHLHRMTVAAISSSVLKLGSHLVRNLRTKGVVGVGDAPGGVMRVCMYAQNKVGRVQDGKESMQAMQAATRRFGRMGIP